MAASTTHSSTSYSPFDRPNPNPTQHLRDDSFSTYLALIRQSFSTDLVAPPPTSRRSSMSFRRTDEDELDVFTAERYFSNTLHLKDSTAPQTNIQKHSSSRSNSKTTTTTTTITNCKKKHHNFGGSRSRSSAAGSASSSANSQSNLLRDRRQRLAGAGGRRSFLGVFRCPCSKDDAVEVEEEDAAPDAKPRGGAVATMSDSSSELFEIESLYSSQQQQTVYAPSEVSIEWSVVTESAANLSVVGSREGLGVVKKQRASGLLTLGCASEKAVNTVSTERVVALERYRAMMEMESASVAGAVAARQRKGVAGMRERERMS